MNLPDTGPCRACGKEATGYIEICSDEPPHEAMARIFACEEHEDVLREAIKEFQRGLFQA